MDDKKVNISDFFCRNLNCFYSLNKKTSCIFCWTCFDLWWLWGETYACTGLSVYILYIDEACKPRVINMDDAVCVIDHCMCKRRPCLYGNDQPEPRNKESDCVEIRFAYFVLRRDKFTYNHISYFITPKSRFLKLDLIRCWQSKQHGAPPKRLLNSFPVEILPTLPGSFKVLLWDACLTQVQGRSAVFLFQCQGHKGVVSRWPWLEAPVHYEFFVRNLDKTISSKETD